ncbi:MAG: glycoside hydrolase family 88 protein [Breznakibacter sp.]
MAEALKLRQRSDGFWNASLDDPGDFGGPETSGTSFFVYGMAWGINNGLLDRDTYLPVVEKAWNGLTSTAVQPSGFLGYVQGVGTNPASSQPVTAGSTADFGVGAFLLAGSEMVKLAEGEMPIPTNFGLASVTATDQTHINVMFSQDVERTSALESANYSIDNGVTISTVAMGANDRIVVLAVDHLVFGRYNLWVSGIKNNDGMEVEPGEKMSFAYSGIVAVTASGYESGTSNTPDKTVDFDISTRWSADGQGQWILYDLGAVRQVTSVDLSFYKGNERKAYFSIYLSADGDNFTEVYNGESSGTTIDLENYDFTDQPARYVKVVGYGNSASTWNSITETRINWQVPTGMSPSLPAKSQLVLFPNPYTGSQLTIDTGTLPSNTNSVAIYDMSGHVLGRFSHQIHNGKMVIEGLALPQGVYMVGVDEGDIRKTSLLVVK